MSLMRSYLSVLRMEVQSRLQYRVVAWSQLITTTLSAIIYITIMLAFYRHGQMAEGNDSGLTATQAVSYLWLTHVSLHLLPAMGADPEVREKIRNGDVGMELCRPLDLYFHWFVRSAAARLGPFLLGLLPILAIAFLIPPPYRLGPPISLLGLTACLLTLLIGLMLSCATMGLTYILLMKVNWGNGPIYIMAAITDLLSGANLPLQLWPVKLQRFLFLQPFAGIIDIPIRFYLGTLELAAIGQIMLLQLSWVIVLTLGGWFLMKWRLAKLVLQGG